MVADFAELHDEVHEVLCAEGVGQVVGLRDEIGDGDALAEGFVDIALALAEVDMKIDLDLQA